MNSLALKLNIVASVGDSTATEATKNDPLIEVEVFSNATYVILGDGECNEGQIWEGVQFIEHVMKAVLALCHLEVKNLVTGYGDLKVLNEVPLTVNDGETVALVGSNGAGKTTLRQAISGLLPTWSGEVEFAGKK